MTHQQNLEAKIPPQTLEHIRQYVEYHRPSGDFLRCLFSNNLVSTFYHADLDNTRCIADIVTYLWNYVPGNCWGSQEKYDAWIRNDKVA